MIIIMIYTTEEWDIIGKPSTSPAAVVEVDDLYVWLGVNERNIYVYGTKMITVQKLKYHRRPLRVPLSRPYRTDDK